jgi:hypothetical protein
MPRKAAKKKRKLTKPPVLEGTIFYVKWNMEKGDQQYFKAIATGKNYANGDFDIKYVRGGDVERKSHPTQSSGSDNLLSDEQFQQAQKTRETHPYKPPRVGHEFQASLTPTGVASTSRYLPQSPLTNEAVLATLTVPFKNSEAEKDMNESGMSKAGWTGGRKKRRCSKKKIKKKMICYKGTKRKLKNLHNLTRKLQINTTLCSKKRLKKWNKSKKTRRRKRRKKKTRKKRGGAKDDNDELKVNERAYRVNTDRILKAEQDGDKLIKNYNALLERKRNLAFLKRAKKGRFMSGKTLKRKHQEIDRELKLLEDKLRSQDHKDLLTIYNKGDDIFYVETGDDGKPILMDMETKNTDEKKKSSDEYKKDHKAKRELLFARKYAAEKRNLEKTRKRKAGKKVPENIAVTRTRRRLARVMRRTDRPDPIFFFRRNIIERGRLGNTLTTFTTVLSRALADPRLLTRERYTRWNEMNDILKAAIIGFRISQQNRVRIDRIQTLLAEFESRIPT